jgi:hypothetical protein
MPLLGALDGRRPRFKDDARGKVPGAMGDVATAIFGEPFDCMGQPVHATKAVLDCRDYQVPHMFAPDAAGRGDETHSFPIAAIEAEGDTNPVAIVTTDLEAIGAPAAIALIDGNPAIMTTFLAASVSLKQQ